MFKAGKLLKNQRKIEAYNTAPKTQQKTIVNVLKHVLLVFSCTHF